MYMSIYNSETFTNHSFNCNIPYQCYLQISWLLCASLHFLFVKTSVLKIYTHKNECHAFFKNSEYKKIT